MAKKSQQKPHLCIKKQRELQVQYISIFDNMHFGFGILKTFY